MPSSTRQNWQALQRLASDSLAGLHAQQPTWSLEDALEHLKLPRTVLFVELLSKAGFAARHDPTAAERLAVDDALLRGVWSEQVIAAETGIDARRVRAIVQMHRGSYGSAPYGKAEYGGMLLDAGGTVDYYSSGRQNGASLAPGKRDEKNPENSPLHGLFIDTAEKRPF